MVQPTALPYGIRDIKLTPYTDASGSLLGSTSVKLPYGRTLSFKETEEFTDLRGDDQIVTTRGSGAAVEWEVESGGLALSACKVMQGGTLTITGTGASEKASWIKKSTDARPFFKTEGQAISDSGGDVHTILDRCRSTGDFEGEFTDGEFFLTKGSGAALPSLQTGREGTIYEFVQNATAIATP